MKELIFFIAIVMAIQLYFDIRREEKAKKRTEQELACKADPICRLKMENEKILKENEKAISDSLIYSTRIRSSTGEYFFRGLACNGDCSDIIFGYQWAESRGISKYAGCPNYNFSFVAGCKKYVSDRIYELEEKNDEIDVNEGKDSCMAGRYSDC